MNSPNYEKVIQDGTEVSDSFIYIKKTDIDGTVWAIPVDEANADYQQYLIDTDGGLPLPEEQA